MAILLFFGDLNLKAQESVPREWSEVLLEAIRNDFARPTVHARNLHHASTLMYDAWAVYEDRSDTYFLGKTIGDFNCPFDGIELPEGVEKEAAQEEAMSYAMYRLLRSRFQTSPGAAISLQLFNNEFMDLGYDPNFTSTDYAADNSPAALGNYMADRMIAFGLQDGSNELGAYTNLYYEPLNSTIIPVEAGNPDMDDPNRWQAITLDVQVDQAGNVLPNSTPDFLSPEWGNVVPFAMDSDDVTEYNRDGDTYRVWNDPGAPPFLHPTDSFSTNESYMWNFALVSVWSSHLGPQMDTTIDISPGSIGNIQAYPETLAEYQEFYKLENGGDPGTGWTVNPVTNQPYEAQVVKRSDYARVLAEFWADGPDSETPPGHWFTILNYVNDNPLTEKRWMGEGPKLSDLEWDVKSYFALSGALHDAAISAWSIKGWYDYPRPVSAIRYMADRGQSSDPMAPNYDPLGLPLIPGYIELITQVDINNNLFNQSELNDPKVLAWRGPDYILNPMTDVAEVGWIAAKEWWPYQRPTFVSPPFAGFISGHSTYSRAAAEVLTAITNDPFFPGGVGEFEAPANDFLVFEIGPSEDLVLEWATYRDASDQCSLSRIWGGIHPPADDIPGRLIGIKLGTEAVDYAQGFVDRNSKPDVFRVSSNLETITDAESGVGNLILTVEFDENMNTAEVPNFDFGSPDANATLVFNPSSSFWANDYSYLAFFDVVDNNVDLLDVDFIISNGKSEDNVDQEIYTEADLLDIKMRNPMVVGVLVNQNVLADADAGASALIVDVLFDETEMNPVVPQITFSNGDPLSNSLQFELMGSTWIAPDAYQAKYTLVDANERLDDLTINVANARDSDGNLMEEYSELAAFTIDTENPFVDLVTPSSEIFADAQVGNNSIALQFIFNEEMTMDDLLNFELSDNVLNGSLTYLPTQSAWVADNIFEAKFDFIDAEEEIDGIDVSVFNIFDWAGNPTASNMAIDQFSIDTKNPNIISFESEMDILLDGDVGEMSYSVLLEFTEPMSTTIDPTLICPQQDPMVNSLILNQAASKWLDEFTYVKVYDLVDANETLPSVDFLVLEAYDEAGNISREFERINHLYLDTDNPDIVSVIANKQVYSDLDLGEAVEISVQFDKSMDVTQAVNLSWPSDNPLANSLTLLGASWSNDTEFLAVYAFVDANETLENMDITISGGLDLSGNQQTLEVKENVFLIDTENPVVNTINLNETDIGFEQIGEETFQLDLSFSEEMDTDLIPQIAFFTLAGLTLNEDASAWLDSENYRAIYDIAGGLTSVDAVDIEISAARDQYGNPQVAKTETAAFTVSISPYWILDEGFTAGDEADMQFYPNPVSSGGYLKVEVSGINLEGALLQVFHTDGRQIFSKNVEAGEDPDIFEFPLQVLPEGMYLVQISDGENKATSKLQVIR